MLDQAFRPEHDARELSFLLRQFLETKVPELPVMPVTERRALILDAMREAAAAYGISIGAQVGSGVACYGFDDKGRVMVALVEPAYNNPHGRYQIPGGYVELLKGESDVQGAARELSEEMMDPAGVQILNGDIQSRLFRIDGKTFYIPKGDLVDEPRSVHGFRLKMSSDELKHARLAGNLMRRDEGLRALFGELTKGEMGTPELRGMRVLPLDLLLRRPFILNKPDQLTLFTQLGEYLQSRGQFQMPELMYHVQPSHMAMGAHNH